MEERIIDDEYGRGIRLKKTKEGFVDVTDELAEGVDGVNSEEVEEEVSFSFPMLDEDDEDLVGLSPEEALALRQKKEEEKQKRKEEYARLCEEGEELLSSGSFHAAELKYEKALQLDELATDASVGYWRAKTSNFIQPNVLVDEYLDEGIDSMEYDLGIQATDIIRRDFHEVFKAETEKLIAEEQPLQEVVEERQITRRQVIKGRVKKGLTALLCTAIPFLLAALTTVILALKIPTVDDNTFILPTVIAGVITFGLFIATLLGFNKFWNAMRMRRKNETLSSTEDGAKLLKIRKYKKIYEYLAINPVVEEQSGEKSE